MNKIPLNQNILSGKSTLTSLLTSNTTTPITANKTLIGTRRIYMTKGTDGTSRVISTPTSILPKGSAGATPGNGSPSVIKVQSSSGTTVQTIQVQSSQTGIYFIIPPPLFILTYHFAHLWY